MDQASSSSYSPSSSSSSSSSSSLSSERSEADQRDIVVADDLNEDDMKNVDIPPDAIKLVILVEVAFVANAKREQAIQAYKSKKAIARENTAGNQAGEVINPALPLPPDPPAEPQGPPEQPVGPQGPPNPPAGLPDIPPAGQPELPDDIPPAGQPELPENIRQRILGLGGVDARLVLENRALYETDVKRNNNRLAIPFGKIRDGEFLSQDEAERLQEGEAFDVELIVEPLADAVTTCKLARWDMAKATGRVNSIYVLKGGWYKDVVSRIGLAKDDIVDLWSFRVNGAINFALVRR